MTIPQRPERWRKSTYSSNNTACIELPGSLDAVRDSKNGDMLGLGARAVAELLDAVKHR